MVGVRPLYPTCTPLTCWLLQVKSLTEGTHGKRGPMNQLACLEMRASLYWNHALTVLLRLER